MNSNKRQIQLLVFLIIILVLAFNYRIYSNWVAESDKIKTSINNLDPQIEQLRNTIEEFKDTQNNNVEEEKQFSDTENEIRDIMSKFISELNQEEIIVLMENLNNENNFKINSFNFAEQNIATEQQIANNEDVNLSTEDDIKNTIDNYFDSSSFSITFVSDYESIVDYIKRINNLERSIFVKSVNINSGEFVLEENISEEAVRKAKSTVSGEMLIEYATINSFAGYENEEGGKIEVTFGEELAGGTNPFIPYNSYIAKLVEQSLVMTIDNEIEVVISDYENLTTITPFEKNDFFFVGSPKDVKGNVELNKNSYNGMWSAKLEYNFMNGSLSNTANLVFDKEILVLKEQAAKINLKIYSPQYSYHSLGLVILDSSGKQHNLVFSDGVYWTDWNVQEASLSNDIAYPAVVSRIYVTDNGEKSNLSGYYLFDDLEVLYTKDILNKETGGVE